MAMRQASLVGGPRAYRGVPPATVDRAARAAIEDLRRTDEPFDADAATAAWEDALAAAPWTGAPCWVHSDLMPSDLLLTRGRLNPIISANARHVIREILRSVGAPG
jgi:aminoglycoside phosphotransferase (APT) family kinase protein